jgi:chromosome segregation ATPase
MTWNFDIDNIAGIRRGEATLERGLNAVRATNWRGKSSFLRAIQTAMGTQTPLTEGADAGSVRLGTGTDTYHVRLRRQNGTVLSDGDPYLTDPYDAVCAELYAFLGEDNEVRRAVRDGENLEAVLTRPLEFENIDERIAELKDERSQVEAELGRAEDAADELAAVESTVSDLEQRYRQLRQRRDEVRVERAEETDGIREQLSEARAERDRVENRVDRLERAVERTEEKLRDRRGELADLDVPSDVDVADDLENARETLEQIERDENLLQSVYDANRRILEEGREELVTDVSHGLPDDRLTCWICGAEGDRETVSRRIEALGEKLADLRERASTVRDRVERLEERRDRAKRLRRERIDLEDEIADLETTLADRRRDLETAREALSEQRDRIDDLAADVERSDDELAEVEGELRYVETELESARERREKLRARADNRETLRAELDDLKAEIQRLRTRKDDLKRRTREAFDESMDEIVDRFDTSFESARLTADFDLVVARDGREASLDALSEGEVELLGFVAALAGYEAFDVGSRVPVLLVDRLGGLDDDNLHALVEYLRGRAEYLVFTAYPEHAAFDGHDVDPADWVVVSSDERPARV